jgi:superfamily I DNA/RNA helicase
MPDITNICKDLNPQQQEAVIAPFSKHILILAGAGCGKTTVLTRRIAYTAHNFCDQSRILALTFTRKAAEEMAERCKTLAFIDPQKTLPVVTTFHAFGLRILHESVQGIKNSRRLGYAKDPVLLDDDQRLKLLATVSTTAQRRILGLSLTELDGMLVREANHNRKRASFSPELQTILDTIATKFKEAKQEKGFWEFSDMIEEALRLLKVFPEIHHYYAHRVDYILIDEFQDTSPLQIEMLKQLICEQNRVFAVGDDDQAIYGFRGADVSTIFTFENHFPDADILKLEINYRSTPAILEAANKIFLDKEAAFRKILRSGKYSTEKSCAGQRPAKFFFEDMTSKIKWVVQKGLAIEKKEAIPFSQMCLLFRVNESLDYVKKYMAESFEPDFPLPKFMTIHGSKGLEFPVVFLCDLEESVFPSYTVSKGHSIHSWPEFFGSLLKKRSLPEFDYAEEKRLFYVGVTRAERFLFLVAVRQKYSHGRIIPLKRSRFLKLL